MSITVYRITQAEFADDIFGGTGGLHAAAGWHTIGRRIIYAGDSLAACSLEILANYGDDARDKEWVWAEAVVPVELVTRGPAVPDGWENDWGVTQPIGDAWLAAKSSAVLAIPSRMTPATNNYLFNPEHPDFTRIACGKPVPFKFDRRLHSEAMVRERAPVSPAVKASVIARKARGQKKPWEKT